MFVHIGILFINNNIIIILRTIKWKQKMLKAKNERQKKAFYEKKYIQLKRKVQEIKINKIINN